MPVWTELNLIGRGAQGSVHLVRDEDGNIRVSKTVDTVALDSREREAAHRECGLLRELCHENIVKYIDSYAQGRSLILIMEWCQGGDLSRHINYTKSQNLQYHDGVIIRWIAQMCDALQYIHAKRVIHRDLKSSNVFLSSEQDVKLGDLGIAKILESTLADADSVVGTPQYLSPELCENRPYSYSSDLWALGCVIYELLALKRPFEASNLLGVVYCVVMTDIDISPLQQRPNEIKSIVLSLLNKQADQRPSAMQIYQQAKNFSDILGIDLSPGQYRNAQINHTKPLYSEEHGNYDADNEQHVHYAVQNKNNQQEENYEYDSFESDDDTNIPQHPEVNTPPKPTLHAPNKKKYFLSPQTHYRAYKQPRRPTRRRASSMDSNAFENNETIQQKFIASPPSSTQRKLEKFYASNRSNAHELQRSSSLDVQQRHIASPPPIQKSPRHISLQEDTHMHEHAHRQRRPHTVATSSERHSDISKQHIGHPKRRASTAGSVQTQGRRLPITNNTKLPSIIQSLQRLEPQPPISPFQNSAHLQHDTKQNNSHHRHRSHVNSLESAPTLSKTLSNSSFGHNPERSSVGSQITDVSDNESPRSRSTKSSTPSHTSTPPDWYSNLQLTSDQCVPRPSRSSRGSSDSFGSSGVPIIPAPRGVQFQRRNSFTCEDFEARPILRRQRTLPLPTSNKVGGRSIAKKGDDASKGEYIRGRLTSVNPAVRGEWHRRRATYEGSPPPPADPPPRQFIDRPNQPIRQSSENAAQLSGERESVQHFSKQHTARLKAQLGPRAFSALRTAFKAQYEDGIPISKHDLMNLVGGSKERFDLCIQVLFFS
mmetsp:Transcript_15703/g.19162  ORF Transcript_15703/g.19162 Transcript_15703/m.19162 type:complete len:825 (+) Transcript_15703:99-2573(+)